MNKRPMLGANYYPEAWAESEQDYDIAMMKKAGMSVVRIAEFAWSKMEPKEGQYDFDWLHRVVDKLRDAGIDVILGTPTATPPIWLEEKDPTMMRLDEYGIPNQHGGRRNNCSNNATYREYCARIVEKMGQEFGKDPAVIGWQIDNEIAPRGGIFCGCDTCKAKFVEYLTQKYGTVEQLNRRWNLHLFSQNYESFEQVPVPLTKTWHSPHLRYDWRDFQDQSCVSFVRMQYDILKKYTKAPVSTDMMPLTDLNYESMAKFVDLLQINHYHDETMQKKAVFWYDYLRTLNDHPFWVTETSTCWNGSHFAPANIRPEGFCRANSWLPVLLGGEMNNYWLWRQHWTGHELMHGAALYASGQPMHIFGEVQQLSREFEKASDFLSATRVKTDVALHFSMDNIRRKAVTPIAAGDHSNPRVEYGRVYNGLVESGVRPDVIAPDHDLSGYKLLFSPYMLTLDMGDLSSRITDWVKAGGTWVVGPMTDIRTVDNTHYTDRMTGMLEDLTGCRLCQQIPDAEHRIPCTWNDRTPYAAVQWLELFDIDDSSESLVTADGYYSALVGKSLLFKKKVGKGTVIVVGALPDKADMVRLVQLAVNESGVRAFRIEGDVIAARREGNGQAGIVAQEFGNQPGKLYITGTMTDLLTGTVYTDVVDLAPYQTAILI